MGRSMVFIKIDRHIDGEGVEIRRLNLKRVDSESMERKASTTCRFLLTLIVDFHLL